MDREAWRAIYSPWGHKESDTTEVTGFPSLLKNVLVSAVQQSESAIQIHMSLLFWTFYPFRSS